MAMKDQLKYLLTHPIATSFKNSLLTFLSPSHCAACYTLLHEQEALCQNCKNEIKPIVSTTLTLTKTYSMKVFAIADYQEPLKRLIISKSWSDYVSGSQLGLLAWQHTHLPSIEFDYLVPIPLHWTRYARRGYNQAEEMAKMIAHLSGKPTKNILLRHRSTPFQSSLLHTDRHTNVRGAFSLYPRTLAPFYHNKHILLVDDLMTTGSTLQEAAKELLKLNPTSITAIVACRVV